MKATNKHPIIEALLTEFTGRSREFSIAEGLCATCDADGLEIHSFRDTLSVNEYQISGMCQGCQDDIFGV